jgi:hypothetical protein
VQLADLYNVGTGTLKRAGHRLYSGGYALDDLGAVDVPALLARRLAAQLLACFLVLKVEPHSRDLRADLLRHREVLLAGRGQGLDVLLALYSYLDASPRIADAELTRLYDELGPEGQEAAMSMAQRYRAEGRAEGRAELLLRLLTRQFGPLPGELTRAVHNGSDSDLETWGDRVLDAKTLDDVFR